MIFQNYHRHSHYTNPRISDSAVFNEDYAKRAVELGHGIISSCEHAWQGNYFECYELAKKYDLKMLFAAEAYWVKDRLEQDKTNAHIWIGAKNETGRKAINDALSEANLTGFYGRPRLDIPLILSLPPQDVWVTTACVAYWQYEDIDEITARFAEHFKDNFFLEVQYHNTERQQTLNDHILTLSKSLRVPIIMGCDSHYIYESDAQKRDDFLKSKGMEYPDEVGWYLDYPDGDTAYQRFARQGVLNHDRIMEAIENTNVFLQVEEYDSPVFNTEIKLPSMYPDWTQEQRNEEYKRLVWNGWDAYKANVPDSDWPHYEQEIQNEIQTVVDTGMADYFIDNYHIIRRGQENGGHLTKTGRGSAVSFITNKLLGFTEVDRIAASVKMYPERFMSTTRILQSGSLPDIDFNVDDQAPFALAQQQILGENNAYPMLAYGTMKAPAAWKLYAKSQDIPFEVANAVSEQLKRYELALKHADEDEKDDIDPDDFIDSAYIDVYKKSKEYQSLVVSWSVAPCSYLLYQGNIRKEIGLVKIKDKICCCMDGHVAEANHFLKNDLLTVKVVDLIYRSYRRAGMEVPTVQELLELCPPDDDAWKMYANGCTMALNQVEKTGTSARVADYKPTNISELCAFVAAIRPGFKSMYKTFASRKPFSYGVKAFDDLIQTEEMPNSFVLYQEQEMAALHYAGIPMDECYTAIKNIAKKRAEKVLAYKDKFQDGIKRAMIEDEHRSQSEADAMADALWKIIEDSASYSFNCVAGSTRLWREHNKLHGFCPTIDEMYRIMNDRKYAKDTKHVPLRSKYLREGYGTALSMFDDERLRINRIVGIYPSGEQEVFRVLTESGCYVDCTMNHRFPTPDGKKTLAELSVGDSLYCKGSYEINRDAYNFTNGDYIPNTPVQGERGFQSHPNGDSVVYLRERQRHADNADNCEQCGKAYTEEQRFELHHIDFDRTHNTPDNYQWLCASCHKKTHYARGRKRKYEKGIPVYLSKIISIESLGVQTTYDIEMADPAHNFVTDSGLVVSNCSHSYCVSLDSLYSAWLKAHYPFEFYETAISLADSQGNKDKMAALQAEATDYFKIKFEPFRYGQDNRAVIGHPDEGTMTNKLSAIKGFGSGLCETLYECGQQGFTSFIDVLTWLNVHSIKAATVEPLIKIDYFQQFGNIPTLTRILQFFDFLKQGTAKQLKKDKLSPAMESIIAPFATDKKKDGKPASSWTITDMDGLLHEAEKEIISLHLPDLDLKVHIQNHLEILGYIGIQTNRPEDRCTLIVSEVWPLLSKDDGKPWAYRLSTQSIGTGKTASLTAYANIFEKNPVRAGDIIQTSTADVYKNKKQYWYIRSYKKIA